jgi:hypothetical protein
MPNWLSDAGDFFSDVIKNTSEVPQDIINFGRDLNDNLISAGRSAENQFSDTANIYEQNVSEVKSSQLIDNFFNFLSENLIAVVAAVALLIYIFKLR